MLLVDFFKIFGYNIFDTRGCKGFDGGFEHEKASSGGIHFKILNFKYKSKR